MNSKDLQHKATASITIMTILLLFIKNNHFIKIMISVNDSDDDDNHNHYINNNNNTNNEITILAI